MPRMIIYGRSFGTADIYLFFKPPLGENITKSTHVPDLSIFRLADVFTSVTDQLPKDGIFHAFPQTVS